MIMGRRTAGRVWNLGWQIFVLPPFLWMTPPMGSVLAMMIQPCTTIALRLVVLYRPQSCQSLVAPLLEPLGYPFVLA